MNPFHVSFESNVGLHPTAAGVRADVLAGEEMTSRGLLTRPRRTSLTGSAAEGV